MTPGNDALSARSIAFDGVYLGPSCVQGLEYRALRVFMRLSRSCTLQLNGYSFSSADGAFRMNRYHDI